MVALASQVRSHRLVMAAIQGDLQRALGEVSRAVGPRDLASAVHSVTAPYMRLASEEGASFFEEQRRSQGAPGRYLAQTVEAEPDERFKSLAEWALAESGGHAVELERLLKGGASRMLTEHVNDTVLGNMAADQKVRWRYQRVPRVDCCAFCGMLGARGAVYTSEAAAGGVVGRGVPVPPEGEKRKRGGQGKGIKPRGSRRLGEDYHDNCYCSVAAIREGVPVDMGEDELLDGLGNWENIYEIAAAEAGAGLKPMYHERQTPEGRVRRWGWVDADGNTVRRGGKDMTNRIVNAMRREKYAIDKDALLAGAASD